MPVAHQTIIAKKKPLAFDRNKAVEAQVDDVQTAVLQIYDTVQDQRDYLNTVSKPLLDENVSISQILELIKRVNAKTYTKAEIDSMFAAGPNGTGTTNYVAKWLDFDTLGNSQIFDDGTYVIIGDNQPVSAYAKFTVQASSGAKSILDCVELINSYNAADMDGTGVGLLFTLKYYNASFPDFQQAGRIDVIAETDWTEVASTEDAAMVFSVVEDQLMVERMRITSGGFIGIGATTNTANLLHVYANNSTDVLETADKQQLLIEQDGAGDAAIGFELTGGQRWSVGINNSSFDRFQITDITNEVNLFSMTYSSNAFSGLLQNSNAADMTALQIWAGHTNTKILGMYGYGESVAGTYAGINYAGMVRLYAYQDTALLIDQSSNAPIYFVTNQLLRMTILAAGGVVVGTYNYALGAYPQLEVGYEDGDNDVVTLLTLARTSTSYGGAGIGAALDFVLEHSVLEFGTDVAGRIYAVGIAGGNAPCDLKLQSFDVFSGTGSPRNTVTISDVLHSVGAIETDSNVLTDDNLGLLCGTGSDMKIYYDGANGNIDTDLVAASDLIIDCGGSGATTKTVVLEVPVWDDLNFDPTRSGGPVATRPDDVTINNVLHKEFTSANNQYCGAVEELPHKAKLSETLYPHVHIFLKSGEGAGTTGVTFTFYWELRQSSGTTSGSTTLTATSAQLSGNPDIYTIYDNTGFAGPAEAGGQLAVKIARTAGDAGDVVVLTYGIHYKIDTIGSRQITAK